MKKLLFLASAVVLLAASCNANYQASQTPASNSKVDVIVDEINASVESEESINLQSDEDVVNSDQAVIQEYEGAANAN